MNRTIKRRVDKCGMMDGLDVGERKRNRVIAVNTKLYLLKEILRIYIC